MTSFRPFICASLFQLYFTVVQNKGMSVPTLSEQQQQALAAIIAAINHSVTEKHANVPAGLPTAAPSTAFSPDDVAVAEAAYAERLEKAMLKNFDYIRRYELSQDDMRVHLRL